MNKCKIPAIGLLLVFLSLFPSQKSTAQEVVATEKSTCAEKREVYVWIHGITSKEDVEKAEKALKKSSLVFVARMKDYPQKYTYLQLCTTTSPAQINQLLKPYNFYVSNTTFEDPKEVERELKKALEYYYPSK